MRLAKGTWVLVLDGAKSLILEVAGEGPALEVRRKDANEAPDNRGEATADATPGVVHGDGPAPRSDSDTSHTASEHGFAEAMAETLYKAAHRGEFEAIVLVAPPKILGTLRQSLHKEVLDRVVGEVPKTLTGHPVDQIAKIVAQDLSAS